MTAIIEELLWQVGYYWREVKSFFRMFKYAYQRLTRGYDDRLFWSLSDYIDEMVVAHVRHLREEGHGYPSDLTQKKWNKVLDTILKGFRPEPHILSGGNITAQWKKYHKDRERALVLLAFYWDNLWD